MAMFVPEIVPEGDIKLIPRHLAFKLIEEKNDVILTLNFAGHKPMEDVTDALFYYNIKYAFFPINIEKFSSSEDLFKDAEENLDFVKANHKDTKVILLSFKLSLSNEITKDIKKFVELMKENNFQVVLCLQVPEFSYGKTVETPFISPKFFSSKDDLFNGLDDIVRRKIEIDKEKENIIENLNAMREKSIAHKTDKQPLKR